MKKPIDIAFKIANTEKRPALISYTVCGDNNKKKSLKILKSISKNLDIVEWGIPHNCPTADGKEIQNSSYRALKNGIKLNDIFKMVKNYKKDKNSKPLILMGYYQMIFNYGEKKFIKKCKEVGVNGLIVVDLSWPDNKKFSQLCKKNSICFVQLIAPTTSTKRMKEIIKHSHEMLYMISMISTTGGVLKVTPKKIMKNYDIIKKINPLKNIAIGFGITIKTITSLKKADGLVVGSVICKEISKSIKNRQNPVTNATIMVSRLKNKIL
jgi:tryptophan synthase alpha chain|tara:strand:- start:3651 stop:4451 length:801 start_codon:yes stop_codon:yes gene_type:complete